MRFLFSDEAPLCATWEPTNWRSRFIPGTKPCLARALSIVCYLLARCRLLAQLRFAARVDFLVARWLERCATNVEAAQRLFKTDRKPTREFGMGVSLVVSSPRWDEPR